MKKIVMAALAASTMFTSVASADLFIPAGHVLDGTDGAVRHVTETANTARAIDVNGYVVGGGLVVVGEHFATVKINDLRGKNTVQIKEIIKNSAVTAAIVASFEESAAVAKVASDDAAARAEEARIAAERAAEMAAAAEAAEMARLIEEARLAEEARIAAEAAAEAARLAEEAARVAAEMAAQRAADMAAARWSLDAVGEFEGMGREIATSASLQEFVVTPAVAERTIADVRADLAAEFANPTMTGYMAALEANGGPFVDIFGNELDFNWWSGTVMHLASNLPDYSDEYVLSSVAPGYGVEGLRDGVDAVYEDRWVPGDLIETVTAEIETLVSELDSKFDDAGLNLVAYEVLSAEILDAAIQAGVDVAQEHIDWHFSGSGRAGYSATTEFDTANRSFSYTVTGDGLSTTTKSHY